MMTAEERRRSQLESVKQWQARNPEWVTAAPMRRLKRQEEQAGRPCPDHCELCGGPPIGRGQRLHFDHDHVTGIFRGWICSNCNLALGLVDDDPERLKAMASYLEAPVHLKEVGT